MSTAEPFMPNVSPEDQDAGAGTDPTAERDSTVELDADLAASSAADDVATGADASGDDLSGDDTVAERDPEEPATRDSAFRTPTAGDALTPDELADES